MYKQPKIDYDSENCHYEISHNTLLTRISVRCL